MEYLDLKILLGLEMSKHSAFGHIRCLGKVSDGHTLKAQLACHIQTGFQNNKFGIFSFCHADNIERPFVLVK